MIAASFRCCRGGRYKINCAEAIGPGAWQRNVCVRAARAPPALLEPARPAKPCRAGIAGGVRDDQRAHEGEDFMDEVAGGIAAGDKGSHRSNPCGEVMLRGTIWQRSWPSVKWFCIWHTRYH